MTFIWLLVWLFASTPAIDSMGSPWGIGLAVCVLIDVLGIIEEASKRRRKT